MRTGSVDIARYVALHPATKQLRALDRDLARLNRTEPPVSLLPMESPQPIDLPAAAAVDPPEPPQLMPDRERARQAVRDEFTYRRLAQPDRTEERYYAELDRLRRRYLEARLEIPEVETEPQIADAARRAREMDRLERRIRQLEDPPNRRALLSLEELKERRTQREQAQRALDELHREEIRRLREALTIRRRRPPGAPEIPPAELARIDRERNEGKVAADLQLVQEEQQSLTRLERETLPPPAAMDALALELPLDSTPLQPGVSQSQTPVAGGNMTALTVRSTQNGLRDERKILTDAIYRDLAAVSQEAARRHGIELLPRGAGVPDRTAELLPVVRRLLTAVTKNTAQKRSMREGSER